MSKVATPLVTPAADEGARLVSRGSAVLAPAVKVAGTRETLLPGTSSEDAARRIGCPAGTTTGVAWEEGEEGVLEALSFGKMERSPGVLGRCLVTTITTGCSTGGGVSGLSSVF